MRHIDEDTITQAVIARHAGAADARLREVMTSLVQHLHGFARDVRLTDAEWRAAIGFLADAGRASSARHSEFALLSDTLGLTTLVTALNQRRPKGCTEETVTGPHVDAVATSSALAPGAAAEACFVRGRVMSLRDGPIAGAEVRLLPHGADGTSMGGDVQRSRCDADGRFHFRSTLAQPQPLPGDGPVGRMLRALGRHAWRPAHLHFEITAPGHERLSTHVFRRDGHYIDSDAVFGVRSSLIADWVAQEPGPTPDGGHSDCPFHTLDFDFVLNKAPAP